MYDYNILVKKAWLYHLLIFILHVGLDIYHFNIAKEIKKKTRKKCTKHQW